MNLKIFAVFVLTCGSKRTPRYMAAFNFSAVHTSKQDAEYLCCLALFSYGRIDCLSDLTDSEAGIPLACNPSLA